MEENKNILMVLKEALINEIKETGLEISEELIVDRNKKHEDSVLVAEGYTLKSGQFLSTLEQQWMIGLMKKHKYTILEYKDLKTV